MAESKEDSGDGEDIHPDDSVPDVVLGKNILKKKLCGFWVCL